jgi:hypothetical protein
MPMLTLQPLSALAEDVRAIASAIEQIDRRHQNARTDRMAQNAAALLSAVELYFEAVGEVSTPEPVEQSRPEVLFELATEALDVANQICATTAGPGSSALVQFASRLRASAQIYAQDQRRLAAEVLRQLELPHHDQRLLPAVAG